MSTYGLRYKEAEALRKKEQYQDAFPIFRDLWNERPLAQVGSRWIYCLRCLGRYQEALDNAQLVINKFPTDQWLLREYAWCIYFQEVKPAQAKSDLGRVVHFAQKMLDISQDKLVQKQAVFSVIDVAKEHIKWDIVSLWCNKLDPALLDMNSSFGGQKSMPDRERWYFARIKAAVQMKKWDQVIHFAQEAISLFPGRDDFPRWLAQARAAQGNVSQAIEDLETLVHKGNAQWYVLMELAQMRFHLGQSKEALQIACKAALAFGEDKAKVNLFLLLAEIGLACDYLEFAAYHVALTKALRIREGWPVRNDLLNLESHIQAAFQNTFPVTPPSDIHVLFSWCQVEWRKYRQIGKERYTGKICNLPEGKKFAFIHPDRGGENVFVALKELPRQAQTIGTSVEYSLEQSFDPKKNRESVRAIDISLIS